MSEPIVASATYPQPWQFVDRRHLHRGGASTSGDVWVVGRYYDGIEDQNTAIHCC